MREIEIKQDNNGALSTMCPFNISHFGHPAKAGSYFCKNECPHSDGYRRSLKTIYCNFQESEKNDNGTIHTEQ